MSFSVIKGQDKAVARLKSYMRQDRLAGAYIFAGPQGIGKYLVAREFAKALNCLNQRNDSCDSCVSCVKIDKDQHPDVHCIDTKEEEIKIEYIRQLQKEMNLKPYEGKMKVFILRSAHTLNPASASALLKTLEESSGNSVIILVTEKPAMLFKTILSRCQVINFLPMPWRGLEGILREEYGMEEKPAHFLAYFCEGRLGRALALKEGEFLREKNTIIDAFGIPGKRKVESAYVPDRQQLAALFNILASWFRDLYLIKVGIPQGQVINLDRKDELLSMKDDFSFEEIEEILRYLSDSLLFLGQNINARLLLSNLKCLLAHSS